MGAQTEHSIFHDCEDPRGIFLATVLTSIQAPDDLHLAQADEHSVPPRLGRYAVIPLSIDLLEGRSRQRDAQQETQRGDLQQPHWHGLPGRL